MKIFGGKGYVPLSKYRGTFHYILSLIIIKKTVFFGNIITGNIKEKVIYINFSFIAKVLLFNE